LVSGADRPVVSGGMVASFFEKALEDALAFGAAFDGAPLSQWIPIMADRPRRGPLHRSLELRCREFSGGAKRWRGGGGNRPMRRIRANPRGDDILLDVELGSETDREENERRRSGIHDLHI